MPWRCPRGATTCLVPLYVPRSIRPLQGRCCAYTSPPLTTTPEKNGIAEIFVSLAPPQPIFFRVVVSSSECDDKTKEIQRVRIPRPMSSDFSVAVANVPPQPREPPCPPVGMSWLTGQFPPWGHAYVLDSDSLLLADVRSRKHLFFRVHVLMSRILM